LISPSTLDLAKHLVKRVEAGIALHADSGRFGVKQGNVGELVISKVGETFADELAEIDVDGADGVPVRRCTGHCGMTDNAGTSSSIDDVDRLTDVLLHRRRQGSRYGIGTTTCSPWNN
jgi:hypothetical protein